MNENEAIEWIESLRDSEDLQEFYYQDIFIESLDMAIQALEKQIPKKVVPRHIRKYDGFDDGECPTCGNSVLRDGFSNDVYCDYCGQKLDWSDEE